MIKQGKKLSVADHTDIAFPNQTLSSVYRIRNIRRTDAGMYICEADNGVELPMTGSFNVDVHCKFLSNCPN